MSGTPFLTVGFDLEMAGKIGIGFYPLTRVRCAGVRAQLDALQSKQGMIHEKKEWKFLVTPGNMDVK